MAKFLPQMNAPTAYLYFYLVVTQLIGGFYLSRGSEPPATLQVIYTVAFLWIIGWWMRRDSRERGAGWVFDMGLFLYVAWPLVLPVYLFKTRGAKGMLPILLFLGVYLAAYVAGALAYFLLSG